MSLMTMTTGRRYNTLSVLRGVTHGALWALSKSYEMCIGLAWQARGFKGAGGRPSKRCTDQI
jgi:hypothetical protein